MRIDSFTTDLVGLQPADSFFLPDLIRRSNPGTIIQYSDKYWGGGELVYLRAAGTIAAFHWCTLSRVLTTYTAANSPFTDGSAGTVSEMTATVMATAGVGSSQPLAISMSDLTVGQYGWFFIAGSVPAAAQVSGVVGLINGDSTGPGRHSYVAINGRQILSAVNNQALAVGPAKTAIRGRPGASFITVSNTDGWFKGITLAGTGIGTNAKITAIEPGGQKVTVDVVNSALVTGNITSALSTAAAAPFYGIVTMQRPHLQGAIL